MYVNQTTVIKYILFNDSDQTDQINTKQSTQVIKSMGIPFSEMCGMSHVS